MFNNHPTPHTQSMRRTNARKEESRRRAARNRRLIRASFRIALAAAVLAVIYFSR